MTKGDIHSPWHYFVHTVLPSYEALLTVVADGVIGGRRDTIALGTAAEACLHLADHIAADPSFNSSIEGAPRSKMYVKQLAAISRPFAITQNVANAWKHRRISDPDRLVAGLDSLLERWAVIRYEDSDGYFFVARKVVLVRLTGGKELFGEDLIEGCILDWTDELLRLRVITSRPKLAHLARKALRSEVPSRPRMHMRGVVGEYVEHRPVFLAYDDKLDRFLPLTDKIGSVDIDFTADISPSPFEVPE